MRLQLVIAALLASIAVGHAADRLDAIIKCVKIAMGNTPEAAKCLTKDEAQKLLEARYFTQWATDICKGQDHDLVGDLLDALGSADPYQISEAQMTVMENNKTLMWALRDRLRANSIDPSVHDWCVQLNVKFGPTGREWPGLYNPNPKPKSTMASTGVQLTDDEVWKFLYDKVKGESELGTWYNPVIIELYVVTKTNKGFALTSLNSGGRYRYDHIPLKGERGLGNIVSQYTVMSKDNVEYLLVRKDRCAALTDDEGLKLGFDDREPCYMTPMADLPTGVAAAGLAH